MRRVGAWAVLPALLLAGAARADRFATVDFDADLRTVLVDLDSIKHDGAAASLWDLQVEGRTSALTGSYFHVKAKRDYDCTAGTEVTSQLLLYRSLAARPVSLAVPQAVFTPSRGSINARELAMACNGVAPAGTVYDTEADAVRNAFGDAVKLPAEQSNRTTHGPMGPMGAPMGPPPGKPGP